MPNPWEEHEPTFYLENLLDELRDLKSDGKIGIDERLKSLQVIMTQFVLAWVSERKSDHAMRLQGQENYLSLAAEWNDNFSKQSDALLALSGQVQEVKEKNIIIWMEKHPKLGALIIAIFVILATFAQDVMKPLISKWLGLPL